MSFRITEEASTGTGELALGSANAAGGTTASVAIAGAGTVRTLDLAGILFFSNAGFGTKGGTGSSPMVTGGIGTSGVSAPPADAATLACLAAS